MATRRTRSIIGLAMIALGVVQASLYGLQSEWIPTALGGVYTLLGVVYLWAEVLSQG